MAKDLPNYFMTFRKLHGLTQKEMSWLLGYERGELISRLECRRKEPTLRVALAYKILFNIQLEELIPGVFEEVEKLIRARLKEFIDSKDTCSSKKNLLTCLSCLQNVNLSTDNPTREHDK